MPTPENTPSPPDVRHAANHWHLAIKTYPGHPGDHSPEPTCPPTRPAADDSEN
ncbi:hypothetical protein AB0E96_00460 [Kitasatospora sp. NPDC036755]|uniref:hypothetical protein n=1 Tax=Kitasatospora sp. NPDC036755 TaxID=3154600 RepID=UPI0033E0125E